MLPLRFIRFLTEPAAAIDTKICWVVTDNFATLKVIERKYLSIPATPASAERLLSVSGYMMSARRNRLSVTTLEALLLHLEMLRGSESDMDSVSQHYKKTMTLASI